MTDKCFYCEAPATLFCDFNLGGAIGGYVRVGEITENRFHAVCCADGPMFTCDMPMCKEHSSLQGVFHASGKAAFSESIDYCPEHQGQSATMQAVLESEANTLRRAVRANAQRRLIKERAKV